MKAWRRNRWVIILSLALCVAMGSLAHAMDGSMPACKGTMGKGYHHGGGFGMKCMASLSKQDAEKISDIRENFFEDTQVLRQSIESKHLAIRSELAKATPDAKIAMSMQRELSDLEAQMAQKRLSCLLKIKEIAPAARMRCLENCGGTMGHQGCKMIQHGGAGMAQ